MTTAWERTDRPKPPTIFSIQYGWGYMRQHHVHSVWRSRCRDIWHVDGPRCLSGPEFPTFAEAIAYAQAQARKDTP